MKLLGTINESDIFPNNPPTPEVELGKLRQAVRVVLFDENKKIALNYYPPKENYPIGTYNLPGGGVDEGESVESALLRESLEEVGCKIKNVKELGVIKEYGVGKKVKHNQDTYCFTAEVDEEKMSPDFTERERGDMLEIRWIPLQEAMGLMNGEPLTFAKVRSLICLQEAKTI